MDDYVLQLHPLTFLPSPVCSGGGGSSATDLVFLIDGSKSVRPENFELVKKFINQIVDTLDVSDKLAQVGLVQYSSSVRQEFPLGRFHTKKDIKAAVRNMSYMEKGTMTGAALKYLIDNSFTVSSGARPGAQKVGIVFTDGRSQDYINDAAKKAKDLGFKMFAVGVGNAVEDELREIASEPVAEHYFYTADFKTINQIGKKLQKKICVEEDPCACEYLVKFQAKVEGLLQALTRKHIPSQRWLGPGWGAGQCWGRRGHGPTLNGVRGSVVMWGPGKRMDEDAVGGDGWKDGNSDGDGDDSDHTKTR
ncbi:Cartilage matrix protein [Saguinus oedipus]|uniref:Cartilage matrix protein n=1 Tax=Saguinus oedipus TaxID=9490 RepID=A0ABQ9VAD9_SAGOE|nr:Cartilage matrix protein [Saguinus oedipus]